MQNAAASADDRAPPSAPHQERARFRRESTIDLSNEEDTIEDGEESLHDGRPCTLALVLNYMYREGPRTVKRSISEIYVVHFLDQRF